MAGTGYKRVSKKNLCGICGKPDWCSTTFAENISFCARTTANADRVSRYGWGVYYDQNSAFDFRPAFDWTPKQRKSGSPQNPSGKAFWESLLPDIQITGSIALPGKEYYRNGTTVGITLVLGCKPVSAVAGLDNRNNPIGIVASSVEDGFGQTLASGLRFHT
ncbi:MAG: hypothetical protein H0V76_01285 [Blastocatellia bacterium]|nr:hypothetical protein [Blastocatellia bacterium]